MWPPFIPERRSTIFVSIASYRDTLCTQTLQSLYKNAEFPERINVGVCQQNDRQSDPDCVLTVTDNATRRWVQDHVRVIRVGHNDARGPTLARFFCSQLYANEDYFFQIDSHSLFVKHWDSSLVHQMRQLQSLVQKPILSHYCDIYENYQSEPSPSTPVTTNVGISIDESGMPYLLGAEYLPPLDHPRLSIFISAQMMCAPGSFVSEVPFDPQLPDLFFGEEILLTIRAFTHGYDVFTPKANIIYHAYTREKDPKYWKDRQIDQSGAQQKVRYLLEMDGPPAERVPAWDAPYGNGEARSVDLFYAWTQIQRPWTDPVKLDRTIFDTILTPSAPSTHLAISSAKLLQSEHADQKEHVEPADSSRHLLRILLLVCFIAVVTALLIWAFRKSRNSGVHHVYYHHRS